MTLIKAMRQMSGSADSAQPVIKRFVLRITPGPVIRLYEWLKYRGWTEEYRLESMVGALGAWKESRDFQLDFLRQRGLQREHAVLDIGCGLLRGGIPLIQYLDSGKYAGIDIRPEVIEQAQEQLRRHRLNDKMPTVIVSGSFGHGKLDDRSYDYIWCFQTFHVLEDDLVDACLGQVSRVLAQNGSFYADINAIYEEKRWKEFPYVRRPLPFYENLAQRHGFRMKELGQVRDWGYTSNTAQSGQYNHLLEFRRILASSRREQRKSKPCES